MGNPRIFVAYGGNLDGPFGSPRNTFSAAKAQLQRRNIHVVSSSALYESDPWGGVRQPVFLNGVWEIQSPYDEGGLLVHLLTIERILGRRRRRHWGPRVLDLDLLSFGARRGVWPGETPLELPHPRMNRRAFVLKPLAELAPRLRPWGADGPTVNAALQRLDLSARMATRPAGRPCEPRGFS